MGSGSVDGLKNIQNEPIRKKGILLVVSGPSASGKNTVLNRLLEEDPHLSYSISATTRSPRPGEVDGTHYFFVSRERFLEMVSRDEFAEWAEIYGNLYGTPKEFIRESLERGIDLVLDIDIQGAKQLKKSCPEAVFVFLMPPSMKELERRLKSRGTEDEESVRKRLEYVRDELNAIHDYDYIIVNDSLDRAVERLRAILDAERARASRIDIDGFISAFDPK